MGQKTTMQCFVPAASMQRGCRSASLQHIAASPPFIQLYTSLLQQLIKMPAAVADACLEPSHETEEIVAWSRNPVPSFCLLSLMFTRRDKLL